MSVKQSSTNKDERRCDNRREFTESRRDGFDSNDTPDNRAGAYDLPRKASEAKSSKDQNKIVNFFE